MVVVIEQGKAERETGDGLLRLSDILLRQYLLRGLLWCQRCDEPWVPISLPAMARYYACSNKECPHPAMPARLMEQRVWSRFVRLGESGVRHVPREHRRELLRTELTRVVVGWWIGELRLEWRGVSSPSLVRFSTVRRAGCPRLRVPPTMRRRP